MVVGQATICAFFEFGGQCERFPVQVLLSALFHARVGFSKQFTTYTIADVFGAEA